MQIHSCFLIECIAVIIEGAGACTYFIQIEVKYLGKKSLYKIGACDSAPYYHCYALYKKVKKNTYETTIITFLFLFNVF